MKRYISLFLVVILCLAFTGCGNNADNNADNLTIASGPDGKDEIMTVNGSGITVGEFRYYLYEQAIKKMYSGATAVLDDDVLSYDWNAIGESGKKLSEEIIDETISVLLDETLLIEKAKENGIDIPNDEKKNIDRTIEEYVSQSGEEMFLLSANAMALNSVDEYKKLAYRTILAEKAEYDVSNNISNYVGDVDLENYESEKKVTAQHILIENSSEKYEDPKETIKEVLSLAKSGADFIELMNKYDEDPGQTDAGYTFGRGEMVKEFEMAAYSLKCNEISDVVETTYGYHIIKRIAGLAELQNYWKNDAEYEINEELIKKISVPEIIKAATNAKRILQEKSMAQNNKNTKGE